MYGGYSSNVGNTGGFFSNTFSYGSNDVKTPIKERSEAVGSPGFKKSNAEQSLRPMTIFQIHESKEVIPDHPLMCDNKPVHSLSVVAKVINIKEQSTHVRYTLEDGTGVIDASRWSTDGKADAEDSGSGIDKISVNDYVQVIGSLRIFSGKRSIDAKSLKPVTDINQITYHGLMASWVHLILTRGTPMTGMKRSQEPTGLYSSVPLPAAPSNYSPFVQMVLDTMRELDNGSCIDGVTIDSMVHVLRGRGTELDVRSALDTLANDSLIYSTTDDETFKVS